ncbi:alpha/beta fold hydrolase [Mycobacteroides franklinii]|uniref:alpha/beta fold hydrolase n=1 Tax=Mycobacteroides franklinii TaxID=948102 RepID=UPI0009940DE0|nr:alpha/beta hydrolase [Mycobacteroides franklinii]
MIDERRAVYAGVGTRELFVEGEGPAVVLLHGFSHSADAWRPLLDRFDEAGQAAVAVDLPGFGAADSARPGAWLPQGDRFVGEMIARHGRDAPVVLVGNSLGAYLTLRAAASPQRLPIRGIVPTGTPGMGWTRLVRVGQLGGARLLARATVCTPRIIRAYLADAVIGRLIYGNRTSRDKKMVRTLSSQLYGRRDAHELLVQGLRMKAEVDGEPAITGISCPTVLVHGRRDRLVALASSEGWHQAIPRSRLVVLDRAGHCPQLDATDEIVSIVRGLTEVASEQSRPA